MRAIVIFLVVVALSLGQTLYGDQYSPTLQLCIVLQVCLALSSRHGWLVLFLLILIEAELLLYQLVSGFGLAHLPTLVLPMAGVQWTLRHWNEGFVVPLRV